MAGARRYFGVHGIRTGHGRFRDGFAASCFCRRLKLLLDTCVWGGAPRALLEGRAGRSLTDVITLDKQRAAGAVLLELLAERHRLREALDVLRRRHGVSLESAWEKLATNTDEDTALYDAWIEHRGLSAALQAVESEIAGIRHGDFSFA